MKYQLVLQWPADSIEDYDALVAIENEFTESLSADHHVDGHDAGSDEANIFITTNSPEDAFEEVREICDGSELKRGMRVAYREVSGDEYTILWPRGLRVFTVS